MSESLDRIALMIALGRCASGEWVKADLDAWVAEGRNYVLTV